jgi:translocation and assembly module TamA
MLLRFSLLFILLSAAVTVVGEEELFRYEVGIQGAPNRTLRRELLSISVLEELKSRPPRTEQQLRRRAQRDPPRFETLLRSHGFFDPQIEMQFQLERRRPRVQFVIDPGPVYTLRDITLLLADGSPLPYVLSPALIGLEAGAPAQSDRIRQADEALLQQLRRRGYPFPVIRSREVRVYHADRAVDILLSVDPGRIHFFAETDFRGVKRVEESFLRKKIPWREGDVFDSDAVRLLRRRLAAANLFNSIQVLIGLPNEEEISVPMRVELQERRHRSTTLGAGYNSDEGWRGRAGWEHRNLLKRGERLSLDFVVSEINSFGEISFRRPDFRRLDQNLTLSARQSTEDTLAFESRKSDVLARIDRPLPSDWNFGAGLGTRFSRIDDFQETEEYTLLYAPFRLDRDRSDDLLDPRTGTRLSLGSAPYWGSTDEGLFFLKSRAALTHYFPLFRNPLTVDSATRVSYSLVSGAARDSIPADERLFAGGGGSLRGYKFQTVGPLEEDIPQGGRSMILLGQELRWRVNETLGFTVFIDGGAVTEEAFFDADVDEFRWGTGAGLRYFTPVGPLRLDVAFPLDRREIDSPWQFYISLGQAF